MLGDCRELRRQSAVARHVRHAAIPAGELVNLGGCCGLRGGITQTDFHRVNHGFALLYIDYQRFLGFSVQDVAAIVVHELHGVLLDEGIIGHGQVQPCFVIGFQFLTTQFLDVDSTGQRGLLDLRTGRIVAFQREQPVQQAGIAQRPVNARQPQGVQVLG